MEPIPLPIPKNQVMMALMEAANRKSKLFEKNDSEEDSKTVDTYDNDYDTDDVNIQHVMDGIEAIHSYAGTYVVRDNEGLAVFAQNPYDLTMKKVPSYLKPPPMVRYGQRIQIADMVESGVYKLARKEGYVIADTSQIVKIGMPQEKACELEGMICSIRASKNELSSQVEELQMAQDKLQLQFDEIMAKPPNHPIIEEYKPITEPMHTEESDSQTTEEQRMDIDAGTGDDRTVDPKGATYIIGLSLSEESLIGTPTPSSPPTPSELSRNVLFLNDDDETAVSDTVFTGRYERSTSPQSPSALSPFICGGSLFPILRSASEDDDNIRSVNRQRPLSNHFFRPRIDVLELDNQSPRSSSNNINETVDFRTGLSGHIALNTIRRKKLVPNSASRRHEVRMMGEHRGIAGVRKIRKPSFDSPRKN